MVRDSLSIVVAQPNDFQEYFRLLEEIAEWLDGQGSEQLRFGNSLAFADYYADSIAAGEVYLGVINKCIVGSFRLVRDGDPAWPDVVDDALYLENLVVRRAWSRKGIGRQLLAWAEQKVLSMGKTCVRLDCAANNPVLREYYQAAGYQACGVIDASYPSGRLRIQRYQKRVR